MLLLSLLLFALPCWLWWLLGLLGSFLLGWILRCVFGACGKNTNTEDADLTLQYKSKIADLENEIKAKAAQYSAKISSLEGEVGSLNASLKSSAMSVSSPVVDTTAKADWDAKLALLEKEWNDKKAAYETKISALENELSINKSDCSAKVNSLAAEINKLKNLNLSMAASAAKIEVPKDYTAASAIFGKKIKADDLKLVEGIGPKIEELFHNAGLKTWASVAGADATKLKEILVAGGERFQMHDPTTWPEQCRMMVEDKWAELLAFQDKLDGGKIVD